MGVKQGKAGFAFGLCVLVLIVLGGALRGMRTLAHPAFDRGEPASVLRSDPALLFHLTRSVVEPERGIDRGADPGPEHPRAVDQAATYTLGLEFVVAAARRFLPDVPLHVLCAWVSSVLAALAVIGVVGMGFELTGCARRALLAGLLFSVLPVNYRTVGFVLMREDLALPLFAGHLWLLLRALRTQGAAAWMGCAALFLASLATWHGAVVLVAIELAACAVGLVLGASSRGGKEGGDAARTLSLPPVALAGGALVAAGAFFVPVLRAKGGPLSPAIAAGLGVLLTGTLARSRVARLFGLGITVALVTLAARGSAGAGDLDHVAGLLIAKLRGLGVAPRDPLALPFEVRMMWQGPFETWTLLGAVTSLQAGLAALPLVLFASLRARGPGDDAPDREGALRRLLGLVLLFSLPAAWMASRAAVLTGLVLPPLAALFLTRFARGAGVRLGVSLQVLLFALFAFGHHTDWHDVARSRAAVELVRAVEREVPAGAPVAADFVYGPTLLACTGRPVPLSPKWERRESRRRVERYWRAFHEGTPEVFRRHVREDLACEFLVVDRRTLFTSPAARRLAGIGDEPRPGSAAEALLPDEASALGTVPGFTLLWTSAPRAFGGREFVGWFQLYRLGPEAQDERR